MSDKLSIAAFWVGMIAAALGLWTAAPARLRPERPLPEGLRSPMLALELLREQDRARVAEFVDPPELVRDAEPPGVSRRIPTERQRLTSAVRRDAWFIAAYDAFLTLAGAMLIRTPFGVPLIAVANAAAWFDIQENRRLIGILTAADSPVPRGPSLWKWAMVFTAFLLLIRALVPGRGAVFWRTIGGSGAAYALFAGVEGWLSIIYQNDQLLESAAGRLAPAVVLAAVFFGTRRILTDGLLAALDRLAATKWLGWLSRWPPSDPSAPGTPAGRTP